MAKIGQIPVKKDAAEKMARKIHALKYIESSALTQVNVKKVKLVEFQCTFDLYLSITMAGIRRSCAKCISKAETNPKREQQVPTNVNEHMP